MLIGWLVRIVYTPILFLFLHILFSFLYYCFSSFVLFFYYSYPSILFCLFLHLLFSYCIIPIPLSSIPSLVFHLESRMISLRVNEVRPHPGHG